PGGSEERFTARRGPAVDPVFEDGQAAVIGGRIPREVDVPVARRRRQVLRLGRRGRGSVRRRGDLVGPRALSDAVLGGDLVVVRLPVGDARVGVGQDGPRIGEERLPIVGRATIDFVVRDWRPSIRARGGPRQVNGPVPGGCGEALRWVGRCRGRARGRRRLVGWIAVPDQVRRDDFVVVSVAIGDGDVDPTRYQ